MCVYTGANADLFPAVNCSFVVCRVGLNSSQSLPWRRTEDTNLTPYEAHRLAGGLATLANHPANCWSLPAVTTAGRLLVVSPDGYPFPSRLTLASRPGAFHRLGSVGRRIWSGGRASNPQPPDWKSGALPIELSPHAACLSRLSPVHELWISVVQHQPALERYKRPLAYPALKQGTSLCLSRSPTPHHSTISEGNLLSLCCPSGAFYWLPRHPALELERLRLTLTK